MSLSKVELKKQLQEMGIKVEGNYVKKNAITAALKMIISSYNPEEMKKAIETDGIGVVLEDIIKICKVLSKESKNDKIFYTKTTKLLIDCLNKIYKVGEPESSPFSPEYPFLGKE